LETFRKLLKFLESFHVPPTLRGPGFTWAETTPKCPYAHAKLKCLRGDAPDYHFTKAGRVTDGEHGGMQKMVEETQRKKGRGGGKVRVRETLLQLFRGNRYPSIHGFSFKKNSCMLSVWSIVQVQLNTSKVDHKF
jgi:hypothetical protein